MRYSSVLRLLSGTVLATMALPMPTWAEFSGHLQYGQDTNPFRLREVLDQRESGFMEMDLRLQRRHESGFGFAVRTNFIYFGDEAEDADRSTASGAVDYKGKSVFLGQKFDFDARVRYTDFNMTYVSRSTGLIGTSSGVPTPDRRDTSTWDARARVQFKPVDDLKLRITADGRKRDYVDYTDVGLSDLDFTHWSLGADATYSPIDRHEFTAGTYYRLRDYDNREGRDLIGDPVLGSELEYEFGQFNMGWEFEINEGHSLEAFYGYEIRDDNVSGYYDTTEHEFGARYRYTAPSKNRLSLQATYVDYAYDNNASDSIIENDEPISSKEGYKISAGYDYFLFSSDSADYWVTSEITREDYDSVEDNYIYDRMIFQVGFKATF